MKDKKQIAVMGEGHREYVLNTFQHHGNCEAYITCFIGGFKESESYDDIPVITLDDACSGDMVKFDAILIAISSNHILAKTLADLHDRNITNIYVIKLFALESGEDFISDDGKFDTGKVDKLSNEKPYLVHLETHVCDYCNLGCKACNNFSPFVRGQSCASIEQYEEDLKRMAKLVSHIGRLFLLGGEPFLEPELSCQFIKVSRRYCPKSELRLLTNGLLLLKMTDEFWQCIKEFNVIIHISAYPPTMEKIHEAELLLKEKKVSYIIAREVEFFVKHWTLYPFEDAEFNNIYCGSAGCHYLRDGKFSKCPDAILIEHLDKELGTHLKSEDSIDIYKNVDPWEMVKELNAPIDLCKYCSFKRLERVTWGQIEEEPDISDWIIEHRYEYEKRLQTEKINKLTDNLKKMEAVCACKEKELKEAERENASIADNLDNTERRLSLMERELLNTKKEFAAIRGKLHIVGRDMEELKGHYDNIRASVSFRIGRTITWLPRKMKAFGNKLIVHSKKALGSSPKSFIRLSLIYFKDIHRGLCTYRAIVRKYGEDCKIYVQYYGGTGDVYIDSAFLKAHMKKSGVEANEYVFVITGNNAFNVTQLFGLNRVEVLEITDIRSLLHLTRFIKQSMLNLEFLHYNDARMYTGIAFFMAGFRGINFADLYKYYVFSELTGKDMAKPRFSIDTKIQPSEGAKTILLSPYAKSLRTLPICFWESLARKLSEQGYILYTNIVGSEVPIPETCPIQLPYNELAAFLSNSSGFIGVRSGLCEIISSINCKKVILYPDDIWPKGGISKAKVVFSLISMAYCDDAIELEYGRGEQLKYLQEEILAWFS
ncbi:4Fe-4S cluster-binding domain-containing protein [Aminipila sp.]|uniref:4Fe-4S cluster-binding domain-containing protein n=1 Tax=Aminipila sp. TaxID=2060095 RepID=UPI00289F2D11|nr:4Fe-4S cluster-binding domain-containing protein [Aminipila sp.]